MNALLSEGRLFATRGSTTSATVTSPFKASFTSYYGRTKNATRSFVKNRGPSTARRGLVLHPNSSHAVAVSERSSCALMLSSTTAATKRKWCAAVSSSINKSFWMAKHGSSSNRFCSTAQQRSVVLAKKHNNNNVVVGKQRFNSSSSSSGRNNGNSTTGSSNSLNNNATNTNKEQTSWLQTWMAPKEMPPRWTGAWYREMVLLCTVFGLTGSGTMYMVRPMVSKGLGLRGSMKDGPWSYRICSIIIMTPMYAALLVAVGTIFGRHAYFRFFAVKMFSRFGIPPELMDPTFEQTKKTFRKW